MHHFQYENYFKITVLTIKKFSNFFMIPIMSPKWKNVYNLISSYIIVVYELEPAPTVTRLHVRICMMDKTNFHKACRYGIVSHFSTLSRFEVGNVNKTTYFVKLGSQLGNNHLTPRVKPKDNAGYCKPCAPT